MLRDAGLSRKQIAAEMRVSDGYVRDLFNDPDRSKAITRRRLRYAGRCQVCGLWVTTVEAAKQG